MIRSGIECRCDRCGLIKFYSNGVLSTDAQMTGDGWEKRLNHFLCCECVAYFDAMVEKFMNEIIYK